MTDGISSSGNVSIKALSDMKAFLSSGADISREAYESEQENKAADIRKRSYVTKNALSKLLEDRNNKNAESVKRRAEEKMQNDANTTNPLKVNTPDKEAQSALSIKRPETNPETNALKVNTPDKETQSALSIKRPETNPDFDPLKVNVQTSNGESALKINVPEKETEAKPATSGILKQKQAILYELKNTMHLKYSAWDIAKRYGISYLQAQEIFVDLNRDENGVVKEFNLPDNSTVSYLV